jgi:uncharacterized membrane protein
MDSTKIVSLKQEQINLENKIQELSKKNKSKKTFLILAIVLLLLTLILFTAGSDGEASDWVPLFFFLFAIGSIVFFTLAFIGKKATAVKLTQAKNRNTEIKMELVKLEHS